MPALSLADRVAALCADTGGEFSRTPQDDGSVVVRLTYPDGDVISGAGATTEDAVTALEVRVAAFTSALGA